MKNLPRRVHFTILSIALLATAAAPARAASGLPQTLQNPHAADTHNARSVVIPQTRPLGLTGIPSPLQINAVGARVRIADRIAETELLISLENPGAVQEESIVFVPVPHTATVKSFQYQIVNNTIKSGGAATAPVPQSARILLRTEARSIYESIVRRNRDPGLLEFAGSSFLESSVFPVPPRSLLRVRIVYEQLLAPDGDRIDYYLPRSDNAAPGLWTITAQVQSPRGIQWIYSPSHSLNITKAGDHTSIVEIAPESRAAAGPFRLSILHEPENTEMSRAGGLRGSFLACPDERGDGGYFLMIAGVRSPASDEITIPPREITLVLDRSSSMAGLKIQQALDAAKLIVRGLRDKDYFNIIDYSASAAMFAAEPQIVNNKNREDAILYLQRIQANGGTNIHEALVRALAQPRSAGAVPTILFLTDGMPTVGITGEDAIRAAAKQFNHQDRAIFTFGVGNDVNAPLLDALAAGNRGFTTYIQPEENVETRVGEVFKHFTIPTLARPVLETLDETGAVSTRLVRDVLPVTIPDLYDGDELVLAGRYFDNKPIRFRISGESNGARQSYEFTFRPDSAARHDFTSMTHDYIPRIWAGRKIASLVDEVRLGNAAGGSMKNSGARMGEVVDELISLSTRHGILSEYTAFFANEPVNLAQTDLLHSRLQKILADRAAGNRTGAGAVAQAVNLQRQRAARQTGRENTYLDASRREVRLKNIQQKSGVAFFRRGLTWIDSRIYQQRTGVAAPKPDQIIEFGSPEYFALAEQLAAEQRAGALATPGEILLWVGGKIVLVRIP